MSRLYPGRQVVRDGSTETEIHCQKCRTNRLRWRYLNIPSLAVPPFLPSHDPAMTYLAITLLGWAP